MKSDDFFSVEKHPTATFKATGFGINTNAKAGEPNYTVRGELTIKGITNVVSIPARITQEGENMRTVADFTIDRSKWDIRYGSSSFFEGLGDKAIYDDIKFTLNMVTKAA
jgi:polyisoprenoid-binding protein YceI